MKLRPKRMNGSRIESYGSGSLVRNRPNLSKRTSDHRSSVGRPNPTSLRFNASGSW